MIVLLLFGDNLHWISGLACVYLGVHTIKCVITGWIIGINVGATMYTMWDILWNWFDDLFVVWMTLLFSEYLLLYIKYFLVKVLQIFYINCVL